MTLTLYLKSIDSRWYIYLQVNYDHYRFGSNYFKYQEAKRFLQQERLILAEDGDLNYLCNVRHNLRLFKQDEILY